VPPPRVADALFVVNRLFSLFSQVLSSHLNFIPSFGSVISPIVSQRTWSPRRNDLNLTQPLRLNDLVIDSHRIPKESFASAARQILNILVGRSEFVFGSRMYSWLFLGSGVRLAVPLV
jgi:hypothetical protein